MILLNVIQSDQALSLEIANYLIAHRFALQTHVDTNTIITQTESKQSIRLFCITKALLFNSIETNLQARFAGKGLEIYAEPVSHLSPSLLKKLQDTLVQTDHDYLPKP